MGYLDKVMHFLEQPERSPAPTEPGDKTVHCEESEIAKKGQGMLPSGYRMKYPGRPTELAEAEEVRVHVLIEGVVLMWSDALQDCVGIYRDEESRHIVPAGFVPYSSDELKHLFGGTDEPSDAVLKLIHAAKKLAGGLVTGRKKEANDAD